LPFRPKSGWLNSKELTMKKTTDKVYYTQPFNGEELPKGNLMYDVHYLRKIFPNAINEIELCDLYIAHKLWHYIIHEDRDEPVDFSKTMDDNENTQFMDREWCDGFYKLIGALAYHETTPTDDIVSWLNEIKKLNNLTPEVTVCLQVTKKMGIIDENYIFCDHEYFSYFYEKAEWYKVVIPTI